MKASHYHTFKSQAMDHARDEARKALAFASIGSTPTGFTPAQLATLKPAFEHYASLGASAAISLAALHGHIVVKD